MNLYLLRAFILVLSLSSWPTTCRAAASYARRRQNWEDHLPGKVLDSRFKVLEFVGSGTFGNVYKAKVLSNEKVVAIKAMNIIISTGTSKSLESIYRKEVNALQAARGIPNVVSIVTSFEENGYGYIVMEYYGSSNLRNLMHSQLIRYPKLIEKYFYMLVGALQHLKTRRIYHQDVKPLNILVAEEGEVRLADFGSASVNIPSGYTRTTTRTYAAPECFTAEEPTPEHHGRAFNIPAADVWSLGIILYEMYDQSTPWSEATENDPRFVQYLHGERILDLEAPRLMKEVIRGALKIQADERWSFARILQTVQAHIQERNRDAHENVRKGVHV